MNSRILSGVYMLAFICMVVVSSGCQSTTFVASSVGKEEGAAGAANIDVAEQAVNTGEPYKIGVLVAITGGASTLGVPERNTIEMLHQEVEATGGIMGPDGLRHPVEVIMYDTESDETKAVLAAKKLEEDQVSIILGPTQSGTTLAIMDTVQKAEVPLISLAASVKIVEPVAERKWVFKTPWIDRSFAHAVLGYLKDQDITKVAWLSINNAFGDSGKLEFEALAPDYGVEITNMEKFESGDTDMSAQLTKIRGDNAEALIIWSILPGAAIATKNAYDLGLEMPIIQCNAAASPKFVELATTAAAEGVLVHSGKISVAEQLPDSDPQKEVLMKYLTDYRAAYNAEPDQFGGCAWDAFNLAIEVMELAGPDRAMIRDQLEKAQGFVGISGIFDFSPSNHGGADQRGLALVEMRNGEWILAEP